MSEKINIRCIPTQICCIYTLENFLILPTVLQILKLVHTAKEDSPGREKSSRNDEKETIGQAPGEKGEEGWAGVAALRTLAQALAAYQLRDMSTQQVRPERESDSLRRKLTNHSEI